MVGIQSWASPTSETVGVHEILHLTATDSTAQEGIVWAARVVPRHYASTERIRSILVNLGKPAAAEFLENKLPTGSRTRSGDLGEILGAQYAARELGYRTITRLRWKDHREMAMRGDDLLGFRLTTAGGVEFLKGEAKSRARLGATTVAEADEALRRDNGRPSPHALEFVADRLHERGEDELATKIDHALLVTRIRQQEVLHFLFTFTGTNPSTVLRDSIEAYRGRIRRVAVGLQVPAHQAFIAAVYEKVVARARKR